ncbi:MAG TPA: ABC transporter permease subunit [Candidatus Limnocylindria bacterium]|nr:ABC transporter permease subunit [Candidatus Limnocylindria bacterium]
MTTTLPGFSGLFRKELLEWRRGRRTWVVLLVSVPFMALTALNAWLQETIATAEGVEIPPPNMDPMVNLLAAVSTQIFVVVTIFAVMSLLIAERESGTLAWTASKPVSRAGIWLAKWLSATGILWLLAGLLPLAATVVVVIVLYGSLQAASIALVALGIGMAIALFGAIVLAASTVITSQAAVAAIGLAAVFLPAVVGAVIPVAPYLPTSILEWTLLTASGQEAGFATPISWAASVVLLVVFAAWRMGQLDL